MSDEDVFAQDIMSEPEEQPSAPSGGGSGGRGGYSDEVLSKKVRGRSRTFYLDLKQSANGKFVKISELSRGGQRSTIMFDEEDLDEFITALQEIKASL